MAWYDYLGGIGQGIEQASRTGLAAVKERQQEEAARVEQELSRLDPMQALTADQVKRYGKYVGAGSFTRTPEGQFLLKQTPQQELAGYQLKKARDVQAAEKEWERLTTPDATGKLPIHSQPLAKAAALGKKLNIDYLESGIASPEHVQQGLKQVGSVVAKLAQQEAALKAAIEKAELMGQNARDLAAIRGQYAEKAAELRSALQLEQKIREYEQKSDEGLNVLAGQIFLQSQRDASQYGTPVMSRDEARRQAQELRGKTPPTAPSAPFGTNPYR